MLSTAVALPLLLDLLGRPVVDIGFILVLGEVDLVGVLFLPFWCLSEIDPSAQGVEWVSESESKSPSAPNGVFRGLQDVET